MNTERLIKHALQEKLAITICMNKVREREGVYNEYTPSDDGANILYLGKTIITL